MKKLLLIAFALGMGFSSFAQVAQLRQQSLFNTVEKSKTIKVNPQPFIKGEDPFVTNERAADIVVGTTWYDLQSNSTMAQRIWAFDDGSIGATWTRGTEDGSPSGYPERGTGYNYNDGNGWGPDPSARVEDTRCGWPSYAAYGENGEIVCAHTGGNPGLIFSWRENKGTGDWNYFNLAAPVAQPLLWPRMITSGPNHQTIQVIACVGSNFEYEGLNMALVYSRSDDGGQTWDPENVILDGMTSDETSGIGGDDYAWAIPRGDTIAFVVFGGVKDGYVMKSYDNGDTWEKVTFYQSIRPLFTGNEGDLPQCGGGDGYNAVAIDDEGLVHVAFGRQIHMDDDPADGWSYYPYSDGLVYWNETMAPLDTTALTNEIIPNDWSTHPLYLNGQLAAWTQPHGDDTIVGVAPYYASLVSMPQLAVTRDAAGTKIVTFFYSGLAVGFANETMQQNYRHIWTRKTELDGNGAYNDFEDLTGDITHVFSECVYPSMMAKNGTFHVLYESDSKPGNSLQPNDTPNHDPQNNNMVYLPVSPFPVGVNNPNSVSFEVMQNMPNPAHGETMIAVKTGNAATINLTISNMLGQQVYSTQDVANASGVYTFRVNVSDFNTGVYFYTVTVGDKSVSKKMIVE